MQRHTATKSSRAQKKTIERVTHEYKHGALESGNGTRVKSRKQAVAIGLKEAGLLRDKKPARPTKH